MSNITTLVSLSAGDGAIERSAHGGRASGVKRMDWMKSATDCLAALRSREVSSLEVLEETFERVDRVNAAVNSIIWEDRERAWAEAKAVEGVPDEQRPLRGLPMTVKEAYDIAGAPSTWGNPMLADNIATSEAVVVERLRSAGAIVFGKTNVPFMLGDFQSYNDIYGTTNNPWDLSRTPGGSSGGGAASLASEMTLLEMGSDIGGSIRNPAHFCGVFGHKPTYGIVPIRGHATPGSNAPPDLAVVGPLARSAADLRLALNVTAGTDILDPGLRVDLLTPRSVRGLRVALWPNDPAAPVSALVEDRVHLVGRHLEELGAVVDSDARPDFDSSVADRVYRDLLSAEIGGGAPEPVYQQGLAEAAAVDPNDDSQAARSTRGRVMSHHTWMSCNTTRVQLRHSWRAFFEHFDLVVMPIAPTPAFPHDHRPIPERTIDVDGTAQSFFQSLFWAGLATASYLPSTVIPTGPSADGLPVGVQLVGPAYGDLTTIGIAEELETTGFAFRPSPIR